MTMRSVGTGPYRPTASSFYLLSFAGLRLFAPPGGHPTLQEWQGEGPGLHGVELSKLGELQEDTITA